MIEMQAPYAPLSAVMAVINRHRQVRLQTIDAPTLARTGVSESLAPRTLRALEQLGLIDGEGNPSEAFERLRVASSASFQEELAGIVRQAYSPVFQVVDPTTASITQIEDAFRGFNPAGQRPRMVTLFTGLLAEAGLIETPPKKPSGRALPSPRSNGRSKPPPSPKVDAPSATLALPVQKEPEGDKYSVDLRSGGTVSVSVAVNLFTLSSDDRAFVISLVDKLTGYGRDGADPAI